MTTIYALIDPRPDHLECYVGHTENITARFKYHIKNYCVVNTAKIPWISVLNANGLIPDVHVLEVVPDKMKYEEEYKWISIIDRSERFISVNSNENRLDAMRYYRHDLTIPIPKKNFTKHKIRTVRVTDKGKNGNFDMDVNHYIVIPEGEDACKVTEEYMLLEELVEWSIETKLEAAYRVKDQDTWAKYLIVRKYFNNDILSNLLNVDDCVPIEDIINLIKAGCKPTIAFMELLVENQSDPEYRRLLYVIRGSNNQKTHFRQNGLLS